MAKLLQFPSLTPSSFQKFQLEKKEKISFSDQNYIVLYSLIRSSLVQILILCCFLFSFYCFKHDHICKLSTIIKNTGNLCLIETLQLSIGEIRWLGAWLRLRWSGVFIILPWTKGCFSLLCSLPGTCRLHAAETHVCYLSFTSWKNISRLWKSDQTKSESF